MHDKDMREKHFFNYNDVFATFWNALIFKSSTPAIDPDYLEDAPTEYVDIPKRTPFNRMRDIMKYYRNDAGLNLALVGIENQTVEDPTMLVLHIEKLAKSTLSGLDLSSGSCPSRPMMMVLLNPVERDFFSDFFSTIVSAGCSHFVSLIF